MAEQSSYEKERSDEGGEYKDTVGPIPMDERLPMKQMPKAPDPSPFTLGPMSPGKRE